MLKCGCMCAVALVSVNVHEVWMIVCAPVCAVALRGLPPAEAGPAAAAAVAAGRAVLHETPGKRKQQQLGDDSRLVEVLMRKQVQGGGEGGHLGSREWGGRLSR